MKTLAKTLGKRVEYPGPNTLEHHQPGNYWKDDIGEWHGVTPNGHSCWLKNHHVEEHEDGTISVVAGPWGSNSILVSGRKGDPVLWHGCIDKGVWKEF
jgi:hypothetical protein